MCEDGKYSKSSGGGEGVRGVGGEGTHIHRPYRPRSQLNGKRPRDSGIKNFSAGILEQSMGGLGTE